MLPPVFVTVPAVLVTLPALTDTASEYVFRSAEQKGWVDTKMNGSGLTKLIIEFEVAVQLALLVTITSTTCPLLRVLVV
jgi:hypothetical protein